MSNAQKVDGLDGDFGTGVAIIKMYYTYNASATLAVKDVVALDFADSTYGRMRSVDIADATVNDLACGVVIDLLGTSGTAAGDILVQVRGVATGVDCDAGTARYDPLIASATAGDAKIYVNSGIESPFAYALDNVSSSECDIYLPDIYNLARLA